MDFATKKEEREYYKDQCDLLKISYIKTASIDKLKELVKTHQDMKSFIAHNLPLKKEEILPPLEEPIQFINVEEYVRRNKLGDFALKFADKKYGLKQLASESRWKELLTKDKLIS